MRTMCLCVWAHISAKLGWIRKMKVFMGSRENTRPILVHITTQAHKPACMHASLRAWVLLCTHIGLVCYPYSIYTFIFLIQRNLAEKWAQACKHIACLHASLRAWVKLCAQRGLVCSPDFIDTFIFLIQPNFAEI